MDAAAVDAKLAEMAKVDYERIGEREYVEFVLVQGANDSDDLTDLVKKAAVEAAGKNAILNGANKDNWEAMNEVAKTVANLLYGSDVNVEEIHHTKKKDAPSGTAKTLCDLVGIPYEKAVSIRMGTIAGQHSVFFALEDEILEIKHTAFSKDIFARGALEKGKDMLKAKKDN